MRRHVLTFVIVAATLSVTPRSAAAADFSFDCISGNSAQDCTILEQQLSVTVGLDPDDSSMVAFVFKNVGPSASSITDIYFDDPPPILGMPATITQSSGVQFHADCSPGSLPSGSPYGFTTAYCADSDSPTQPNGVNPGEWLELSYTLQGTYQLSDVLEAIQANTFRIGIHVQGFAGGGSESGLLVPIPEPGSLLLLGSGLALMVRKVRGRRRDVAGIA